MIDAIGYWDVDVIPEDWRLFFKAFCFAGQSECGAALPPDHG